MRLQAGHLVPCLLVAMLPMLEAQVPPDSTFPERARAAWTAAAVASDLRDATLPRHIAQLAGLNFQAKADRLTPDLDSARALSVMSGGRLRESPWGWFALGRQLETRHGSCRAADKLQWNSHCRRVFDAWREALAIDSGFAPVMIEVNAAIPWPLLWAEPEDELRQLALALQDTALPTGVRLALERTHILLATTLASSEVPERDLILQGGTITPGELHFITARSFAAGKRALEALGHYSAAAGDRGFGDHADWIRADIALIGNTDELAAWDGLADEGRERWIREFWERRDLEDGTEPGGRLVEHVARWRVAFRDYRAVLRDERLRIPPAGSRLGETCVSGDSTEVLGELVLGCNFQERRSLADVFDDRGLAYLRHGPPQRTANYPGLDHYTLESWLYAWPGEVAVIHFDRGDNPALPFGMSRRVVQVRGDPMATCQVAPRYCAREAQRSMGVRVAPEVNALFMERSREQMDRILTTDGAPQRFRNAFKFNAGAYGLGSAPERATLAIDVPLEALRKLVTTDSTHVALRWQVRIRSSEGMWPVSVDTVKSIVLPVRDRKGDDGRYLTFAEEFAIPPGTYDLRLVLSDSAGTTGAMYSRDGVPMISGTAPNLSDLVLMPDGGQGAARSIEGHVVRLSPTFTPGSARFVQVGYLLTGFADRDVRVTVEVREVKKDAEPRIAVTFTERPISDREFRTQRLGLDRLRNGAWDLSVSLTRPDGTTVTRTQRLVVRS